MSSKKVLTECPSFSSPEELQALGPDEQAKVDRFLDREIPLSETRSLTRAEREQFERAIGRKRGPGRQIIGRGAKVVAVSLEKEFLESVDAYARRYKLKRSEMIVQGLRKIMAEKPAKPQKSA